MGREPGSETRPALEPVEQGGQRPRVVVASRTAIQNQQLDPRRHQFHPSPRPGKLFREARSHIAFVGSRTWWPMHPAVGIRSAIVYTVRVAKDHGLARCIAKDVEPTE